MLKDRPARPPLRRTTRRKGLRDIICLILLIVLAFFIFVFGKQQYELSVIRAEKQQLYKQIETLRLEQQRSADEKKKFSDPQYIEKVAREQGMAKPGEIPYITNEAPANPNKQTKNE